jgi:hypothetical protein
MTIMTYCNFIALSYQIGFKYTGINPCPFCKIYPILLYHITTEKVLPSAKLNFTTHADDGVRKPKVSEEAENTNITHTVLCRC